jgi:hypothetical protein
MDKKFNAIEITSFETGSPKKIMIFHQCGEDKELLIQQLKFTISSIESNFDGIAQG